jgi:hypothetical protein
VLMIFSDQASTRRDLAPLFDIDEDTSLSIGDRQRTPACRVMILLRLQILSPINDGRALADPIEHTQRDDASLAQSGASPNSCPSE